MARWKTAGRYTVGHGASALGPPVDFALLAIAAAFLGVLWLTPATLILPVLSLVYLAIAGGVALVAWWLRAERGSEYINLWDVAGACAFIGFAAGMLSRPEPVMQLFGLAATAQ